MGGSGGSRPTGLGKRGDKSDRGTSAAPAGGLFVFFGVLQAGDLITTWLGGLDLERNPFMLALWVHYGFFAIVLGKALFTAYIYLVVRFWAMTPFPGRKWFLWLLNAWFGIVVLSNLCYLLIAMGRQ